MSRAQDLIGFETKINLSDGIRETMDWYSNNLSDIDSRYNVFTEPASTDNIIL